MAIYDIDGNEIVIGGGSATIVTNGVASPNQYDIIVKNINHRGYTADGARENTIAAFKASKAHGFYYVETDILFTSDNVPILQHDGYVTYNGTSTAVNNLTYAQMQEVYADIATFEELIALSRNIGLHPYLELKGGSKAQIESLLPVVDKYNMRGKVTWFDVNATLSAYIHALDPYARIGVEANQGINTATINYATAVKGSKNEVFIDCHINTATAEIVEMVRNAGFPLEVWTFVHNDSEIINADPYISGWTTNNFMAGKVLYDNEMPSQAS